MKIVHVTDSSLPAAGGVEHPIQRLARHQREAGHHVHIVTAGHYRGQPDELISERPGSPLRTALSPLELSRLTTRAVSGDIDVLHAHISTVSPLAVHTARRASALGVPVAITVHSLWPRRLAATIVLAPNLVYGARAVRATWSAVSVAAARSVATNFRGQREVMIVPNIVDTAWWGRGEGAAHPKTGHWQPLHIACVGRLAGHKRVLPMLEMIASVRARTDDQSLRVSIVGDGPRRAEVEQAISRLKLFDCVQLLGQRTPTEIRDLLHSVDLFIASARREPFGTAALEARACGLPVVGFRGTGLADFIADGIEGVLVDTDAGMVDALVSLIRDPARLAGLQIYARARPPSINPGTALQAVQELYDRTRDNVEVAGQSPQSTGAW